MKMLKYIWTPVTFCGFGGATAVTLRAKLSEINLANFCTVYVEIGSNDLCSNSKDVVVSNIWVLIAYLRTHGAAHVIFGEVLFRTKTRRGRPSLEEFRVRVDRVNRKMKEWMGDRHGVYFWVHRYLHSAGRMSGDSVHFTTQTQMQYWRSVRGALIRHLHR